MHPIARLRQATQGKGPRACRGEANDPSGWRRKNRLAFSVFSMLSGGTPKTSAILQIYTTRLAVREKADSTRPRPTATWSCSSRPLKRGAPVYSSTSMQPTDQTSIFSVYGTPRITSGER